ncbi:MAG TPA: tetratricopeptide repeat protein [Alphaproteobacteria bacterium]|nr:tetratricopeptide repeat protein [Alphaproteobacteria bacterium]
MKPNFRGALAALAVGVVMTAGTVAWAMGTVSAPAESSSSGSSSAKDADYAAGEQAVNAGKYADAVGLMQKVVGRSPQNADAWNYLGFSYRKLGKFSDALAAYEKALAINPDHLGANEYLGELYIQTGDMPKAEARLARLDKLCGTGCTEYRTLKSAIDAKKKNG